MVEPIRMEVLLKQGTQQKSAYSAFSS